MKSENIECAQTKDDNLKTQSVLYKRTRLTVIFIVGIIAGCLIGRLFPLRNLFSKENSREQEYDISPSYASPYGQSKDNISPAEQIQKKVRILCWIMTNTKGDQEDKARSVKLTWGKHCNKLIFIDSAKDLELPFGEGRSKLWGETLKAYKYIYEHHINDADWFLKADDDTYAIVEKLRYMLYPYSPESPVYFGCKFKPLVKQEYISGGAGNLLSREAVRRFVLEALPNPDFCGNDNSNSKELQNCLAKLNITALNAMENEASCPFIPANLLMFNQHRYLKKKGFAWYHIYKSIEKSECCSNNRRPNQLYLLEYLIYHLGTQRVFKTLVGSI